MTLLHYSQNYDCIEKFFDVVRNASIYYIESISCLLHTVVRLLMNENSVPYFIKKAFLKCWKRVSVVSPETCFISTAFYFTSNEEPNYQNMLVLHKKLVSEPFRLLEFSQKIFEDPILVEILLYTLRYFICLSHVENAKIINPIFVNSPQNEIAEINMLSEALHCTEDLLIIQLTIFASVKAHDRLQDKYCSFMPPRSVLSVVGRFIHEFFVKNPTLIKLVHYHSYDIRAIPWMVKFVPSMHLFNSYFPTLIQDVQSEKQLNFLCLTFANVSLMYPVEQVISNISLFVSAIKQIGQSKDTNIFLGALNALNIFSRSFTFSPLVSTVVLADLRDKLTFDPANTIQGEPNIKEKVNKIIKEINKNLIKF
ncbi:hypothetical protein MXB_3993 [Myxobolus squamalis]|nr:hypothetical protein MXB_3993 [Myxobolus squamalis]